MDKVETFGETKDIAKEIADKSEQLFNEVKDEVVDVVDTTERVGAGLVLGALLLGVISIASGGAEAAGSAAKLVAENPEILAWIS